MFSPLRLRVTVFSSSFQRLFPSIYLTYAYPVTPAVPEADLFLSDHKPIHQSSQPRPLYQGF